VTVTERKPSVAAAIAMIVGGSVITVTCLWLGAEVYLVGETASGRVVHIDYSQTVNRPCAPVIEYAVESETHRWQTDVYTAPCEYEVGQEVELYYWADAPADPFTPSFARLVLWPGLPMLVGLLLVWLGTKSLRRRPTKKG
jgi:hypothetical protein